MFYQFHEKVFSEDFCQNLLKTSQNIGFEQSKVNIYGEQKILTHIHNNSRFFFIIFTHDFFKLLFKYNCKKQ